MPDGNYSPRFLAKDDETAALVAMPGLSVVVIASKLGFRCCSQLDAGAPPMCIRRITWPATVHRTHRSAADRCFTYTSAAARGAIRERIAGEGN